MIVFIFSVFVYPKLSWRDGVENLQKRLIEGAFATERVKNFLNVYGELNQSR